MAVLLPKPIAFEWDKGNRDKNYGKHGVSDEECEQAFFDSRKKTYPDPLHSGQEKRYILIGQTKNKQLLFIVFTVRRDKVRVISARHLNRKEQKLYEETT